MPRHDAGDTIAAIATAPGQGGVGVVRISGKAVDAVVAALLGKPLKPRHATYCDFRDAAGEAIDQGLALLFRAPASFTGEDVLELQGHGGNAVLHALLQRCLEAGCRLAEPGEFTRRAFLNGKLDLAQAEAVADLIEAATVEAARGAVRSLGGAFSREVQALVAALIDLRMLVEATLDFPEEEIDFLEAADARGQLERLRDQLAGVLRDARQGSLLREGVHVVLIGRPNVGKSSLLNSLSGEEVAIVTPVAGTTRDTIRQKIDIGGVPLHVIDTAGLRDAADEVEKIGIARTWAAVAQANVALLLLDAASGETDADRAIVAGLPAGLPVIRVHNKIDLTGEAEAERDTADGAEVWLSARTGAGLERLRRRLLTLAGWQATGEGVYMARARHVKALRAAAGHLEAAAGEWTRLEVFAEELRGAQQELAAITGEFTADDLLGEIFSRFCIGK